ncbi:cyclic AMP-responsive element-binding protein 3 [Pelomyxa schiedti]|nr:cyclic AMP-responsive element-binding protein 3 [Pelomyxa schiedti]
MDRDVFAGLEVPADILYPYDGACLDQCAPLPCPDPRFSFDYIPQATPPLPATGQHASKHAPMYGSGSGSCSPQSSPSMMSTSSCSSFSSPVQSPSPPLLHQQSQALTPPPPLVQSLASPASVMINDPLQPTFLNQLCFSGDSTDFVNSYSGFYSESGSFFPQQIMSVPYPQVSAPSSPSTFTSVQHLSTPLSPSQSSHIGVLDVPEKKVTPKKRKVSLKTPESAAASQPVFIGTSATTPCMAPLTPPPCSTSSSSPSTPASVQLPRDVLLTISSQDLLLFSKQIQEARQLSAEEQNELKRQKRLSPRNHKLNNKFPISLVKNRESAQLSRQRKREQVKNLEAIIANLGSENILLKKEAETLKKELEALRLDNTNLRAALTQFQQNSGLSVGEAGITTAATSEIVGASDGARVASSAAMTHNAENQVVASKNLRAAGVCLMIVLFTFGLLMNSQYRSIGENGDQNNLVVAYEPQETYPKADVMNTKESKVQPQNGRRLLLEDQEEDDLAALAEYRKFDDAVPFVDKPSPPVSYGSSVAPKPRGSYAIADADHMSEENEDGPSTETTWQPKNMTYLVCNDVVRLDPPYPSCTLSPDNPVFALILPQSALNTSSSKKTAAPSNTPNNHNNHDYYSSINHHRGRHSQTAASSLSPVVTPDNDFVEITCSVDTVEVVPHRVIPPMSN